MDEAALLEKFREAYRGTGLVVRFYPKCVTGWRWQLGMNGDGEHFELLAWSGSADGLLDAIRARARVGGEKRP
jgi:hypothetical protein